MICVVCGTEFIHSKLDKNTCSKKCREKKYYADHKEKLKEYHHQYYEDNKEKWN